MFITESAPVTAGHAGFQARKRRESCTTQPSLLLNNSFTAEETRGLCWQRRSAGPSSGSSQVEAWGAPWEDRRKPTTQSPPSVSNAPNPHACDLRARLQGPVEAVTSQLFEYFPRATGACSHGGKPDFLNGVPQPQVEPGPHPFRGTAPQATFRTQKGLSSQPASPPFHSHEAQACDPSLEAWQAQLLASSWQPPKATEWLTLIGGRKKLIFHGYLETSEKTK